MSREIKFRAWDKKSKCIKDLIGFKDCRKVIQVIYLDEDGDETFAVVDKEQLELMQYTGLKDKNGKEIYEGDILKFYNDTDYMFIPGYTEVVFEDGTFACKHFKYGIECLVNIDVDDMDITVAGNIYENPELLEGEE